MFRSWVSLIHLLDNSKLQSDVLCMILWYISGLGSYGICENLVWFRKNYAITSISSQHAQSCLHPVMICIKAFFCSLYLENVEQFCCVCMLVFEWWWASVTSCEHDSWMNDWWGVPAVVELSVMFTSNKLNERMDTSGFFLPLYL